MAKTKVARLLEDATIAGTLCPCNTLIETSVGVVTGLVRAGSADTSPDAIAYLQSIGVQIVKIGDDTDSKDADPTKDAPTDDPTPTA